LALWLFLGFSPLFFQRSGASVCPDGAPEAPEACTNHVYDCISGRAADPCECLEGFYPVGKQGWYPTTQRGYEFACCPGQGDGSSCGEEGIVVILSFSMLAAGIVGFAVCTAFIRYSRGLEPLTPEDLALKENPIVHDGWKLHQTVEKHFWCVTLDDLKQFRRLVGHAIAEGVIKPNSQDPFDTSDMVIGPSMYTVNMQYIKPVTAAAGNPSWALMKHPKGLKCDLFITHGWAEGIFEFVDKVVNSWPFGAKAAYVCFLSNPQNLDIGEMIQSPEGSPFTKALQSATQVLAAPNHRESIYTRAWCVFEAYLAYSWQKSIYTAVSPPPQFWSKTLRAMSWSVLMLGLCFSTVMVGNREWRVVSADTTAWISFIMAGFACLSGVTSSVLMWKAKYHWKLTRAALYTLHAFVACLLALTIFQTSFQRPAFFVPFVGLPIIAWALECDRLLGIEATKQSNYLRQGFTGKVRHASTSNPADGERIRNIIFDSGAEAAVDEAVQVLLRMNLSTKELRTATSRAGPLGDASSWSRGLYTITMVFWVGQTFNTMLWRVEPGFRWIPLVAAVQAVVAACGLFFLPRDRRPFAQRSAALFMVFFPKFVPGIPAGGKWGDAFLHGIAIPLLILMALAGPARTARLPFFGPMLVRLLFGQNAFRCQKVEANPSDSVQLQSWALGKPGAVRASEEKESEDEDFVSI